MADIDDLSPAAPIQDTDKFYVGRSPSTDLSAAASDLKAYIGTGTGTLNVKDSSYGAKGDGVTDDTAAIQDCRTAAAASGTPVTVYFPDGDYFIASTNVFQLFDNCNIKFSPGAKITVSATATLTDASAASTIYDNGIFYVASGASLSDVTFENVRGTILRGEVQLFQLGADAEAQSHTLLRTGIKFIGCKQTGGCGWHIRRSEFEIDRCSTKETLGNGIFALSNDGVHIHHSTFEHSGVDVGETTFVSASHLIMNNSTNVRVHDNKMLWSGGSAIIHRASSLDIENISYYNNYLYHSGEGAIGVSIPSFASGPRLIKNVRITDNHVSGYISAEGAGSHGGIIVGTDNGNGEMENVLISGNVVDLLGPGETWDDTAFDIVNEVNTNKDHEASAGTTEMIQALGQDSTHVLKNVTIADNILMHGKRRGIYANLVAGINITDNLFVRCGWERNSGDAPLGSAHQIHIAGCGDVNITGNLAVDANPGCNGGSSALLWLIYYQDSCNGIASNNNMRGYSADTSAEATSLGGLKFDGSADGTFSAIASYDSQRCGLTVSGNRFGATFWALTTAGATYYDAQDQGDFVIKDNDLVTVRGGSTTLDVGSTNLIVTAGGATTQTLPDPRVCNSTKFSILNTGLGLVTIAEASGTNIVGGLTLKTGESRTFIADGDTMRALDFANSPGSYNVRDYKAVGDGITDDTAAIQAAIDAVPTLTHGSPYDSSYVSGGGIVYLPRGQYLVTSTLEYPGFIEFRGEGALVSQILFNPASSDTLFAGDSTKLTRGGWEHVRFNGLWIHGDGVGGSAISGNNANRGLDLSSVLRFNVDNCIITNFNVGLYSDGTTANYYSTVRDSEFRNNSRDMDIPVGGPVSCFNVLFERPDGNWSGITPKPDEHVLLGDDVDLIFVGGSFEPGEVVSDADFVCVRTSNSGVTFTGTYIESAYPLVNVDVDSLHAGVQINIPHQGSAPLLLIENVPGTAETGGSDQQIPLKTMFGGGVLLPELADPFFDDSASVWTLQNDAAFQASAPFLGQVGIVNQLYTTTASLQTGLYQRIPGEALTQYRGQTLHFVMVCRETDITTSRFQVIDLDNSSQYKLETNPIIRYDNGYIMKHISFKYATDGGKLQIYERTTPANTTTSRLEIAFMGMYIGGIQEIPYNSLPRSNGGNATLTSGTATVTLPVEQVNTSYHISLTGDANETFYYSAKTVTGFTINSSNGSSTADCDWNISR